MQFCTDRRSDLAYTRCPGGDLADYGAILIGHQRGGYVLSIMRVELPGRICCGDDHSFLWPQEPRRARRLGIPKAICMHELRIFAFYHSGAELAPFANSAPPCERATLKGWFEHPRFKAGLHLNWMRNTVVCPCISNIVLAQIDWSHSHESLTLGSCFVGLAPLRASCRRAVPLKRPLGNIIPPLVDRTGT